MKPLEIINQLGYNSFTKDGIVCITDKNNNDTPLTVSYEEDKIVYTGSSSRKIKINSYGDIEADIGNGLHVKADKDCEEIKILARSTIILRVKFRCLDCPVDRRDFDITAEDPINIKYITKQTFRVNSNGLIIRSNRNKVGENLRNNADEFLKRLISAIKGSLSLVSTEKLDESLGMIYRALEPMVKGRLNLQTKLGGFAFDKYGSKCRKKAIIKKQ